MTPSSKKTDLAALKKKYQVLAKEYNRIIGVVAEIEKKEQALHKEITKASDKARIQAVLASINTITAK